MILVLVSQIEANTQLLYAILYIKTSGSESWPRKVELMHIHSKKGDDYCEYLQITTKPAFVPIKANLMVVIFIN